MVQRTWSTEDREKLWKILKDIGIGMFVRILAMTLTRFWRDPWVWSVTLLTERFFHDTGFDTLDQRTPGECGRPDRIRASR